MRLSTKIISCPLILFTLLLPLVTVAAEETQPAQEAAAVQGKAAPEIPTLGKLIPLASDLSTKLATLQSDLADGFDVSGVEERITLSRHNLEEFGTQLENLKASENRTTYQLAQFTRVLEGEIKLLDEAGKPLTEEIEKLEVERKKWLEDKANWDRWQSVYADDDFYRELQSTFDEAQVTIQTALDLLGENLGDLLAVQQRLGAVLGDINRVIVEVDSMVVKSPVDEQAQVSPPMFSYRFLTSLTSIEWYRTPDYMRESIQILIPFLRSQGWILILQLVISISIIVVILRNRAKLRESEHWGFVVRRPVSIGVLTGFLLLMSLYSTLPPFMQFVFYLVAGTVFIRLLGEITKVPWKRNLVFGLIVFVIIYRFLSAVRFPEPVMRLYVALAALAGLIFCLRLTVKCLRREDPRIYARSLRLGALFFAVIVALAVWGGRLALAGYVLESSIRSFLLALGFLLIVKLAQGAVEWVISIPALAENLPVFEHNRDIILRRSLLVIKMIFGVFWFASVLVIWRVYDRPTGAISGVLSLGFNLGEQKITLGLLIVASALFYGSFVLSSAVDKLFSQKVFIQKEMDTGVQQSLSRLVHYALVFAGFMIAMSVLGFDFTKLTIIFGALSVGIGFGLQNIVNNFVCGLIMLFERPIRVGDVIEFGGVYSEVKNIGLRATWVRTFDNEEIVVPNSDLITNQVTNCTLTDRQIRRKIVVGVAYGSDIPLVFETLKDIARTSKEVLDQPEPLVLFKGFGDSTLDFQLLVWIGRFEDNLRIQSDLCQEIDRRFREAGIEIAFPQRDLHLRSVDEEAGKILTGAARSEPVNEPEPESQKP